LPEKGHVGIMCITDKQFGNDGNILWTLAATPIAPDPTVGDVLKSGK